MQKCGWIYLFLVAGIIFGNGCKPKPFIVVGNYTRQTQTLREALSLRPDNTYEHEITYTNGSSFARTNVWTVSGGVISLRDFYDTFDDISGKDVFPPVIYTSIDFEPQNGMLVRDFDRGHYFQMATNK